VRDRYRIVLETAADGATLSGSKDALKQCVRAGQTVRVGIHQLSGIVQDDTSGPPDLCFIETHQPFIPTTGGGTSAFAQPVSSHLYRSGLG
jgi:hypothetical protein